MTKPSIAAGYDNIVTQNCERVLVTLLRGLGPWKDSVYLVGGLTPRYLVMARPPDVPAHAGTGDVDIVVEMQMLADTDAYHSLEENLRKLSFSRAENKKGEKVSWRWEREVDGRAKIILELLADDPELGGGKVQPLPTDGSISALNIPHASMVFDLHEIKDIKAELLDDNGIATETIRHADIVCFTCLKAFAFDQRFERKDAHDLVYCIEHLETGLDGIAACFKTAMEGKHRAAIEAALGILAKRFADDASAQGVNKDGPVAVSRFELGEDAALREARIVRQRDVAGIIMDLLKRIAK
ncbi:antitoxin [Paracoccus sp. M683]|uniref:antitoxin n=1 Tax=Paracoccus sp. M683 TaxID=2594268 RepID=UPI00117CCCCF|nr:antitoxin [Paracoccus sp. M683]TRW95223.1 antitoxin [Paracoccus sp. M683]